MLNVDEDVRKEKYLSNKTVIVVKNVFAFDRKVISTNILPIKQSTNCQTFHFLPQNYNYQ